MKKIISLALALVMLATCVLFASCNKDGKENEEIIVHTNAFFAPFEYYDGDEIVGVDVEIMNLVGKKLGKDIKFVNTEFAAIIDNVKEGKVCDAGAAGITITDERKEKVDFSTPYYTSVQYVIFKADDATITTKTVDGVEYIVWDALAGKKIGIAMNQAAFESLGFSIYNMFPWDGYEALSKGMADFSYMATGPMIMLNWHEITPFFVDANQYTAGNYFTISLDRWNSLSAEAQALFEEAMAATTAYSVELVDQQMAMVEGALAEKGGKLSSLNEADTKMFNDLLWNLAVKDSRALAANGNCSAEMETVLAACAAFLELPLE